MFSVLIRVLLLAMLLPIMGARADHALPRMEDRVRIAEAYRLADAVAEKQWPGWGEVPFVLLLLTEDTEYLYAHPYPPDEFVSLGVDAVVGAELHARPSTGAFGLGFAATFPAVRGVNTVVIGTPEHTGHTSTRWVLTALHEHFHQLQYTRPWYYEAVAALGLANGDETGMWQLNYPFPYDAPELGERFAAYRDALAHALDADDALLEAAMQAWAAARSAFAAGLAADDYRYFAFQLWQEGVARYTEYMVARAAITEHRPLPAFAVLDDFVPYQQAHSDMMSGLREELESLVLARDQRLVVYPVGAAEALLLDRAGEDWKARYFSSPLGLGEGWRQK
ncbi:MAG: hypothetical protein HKN58_11810 [Xanthomonadales bacterium]|nr:hypothetical protein [Xanthomonadales bacterium]